MKRALKLLATLTTLSVVLSSALPASGLQTGTKASVASPSSSLKWEASIIPADYMALGNSLPSGPNGDKSGYGLTANGINNWYILCAKGSHCDYRFAIFLFTNAPEKANVTFRVLSPDGQKRLHLYVGRGQPPPRLRMVLRRRHR